jgi:ribonucleoside-diphosphate reductase beta chain
MRPDPWVEVLIKKTAQLGTWTVEGIDLERDKEVWLSLTQPQRAVINRALSRFQHGEGQVVVTLNPLIERRIREGRVLEAQYIGEFQREEEKHQRFFNEYLHQVVPEDPVGTDDPFSVHFRDLFDTILERELSSLEDGTWQSEVRALTTYMLVCEGTIAETAYHGFFKALRDGENEILPGLLRGIELIKRDEARHVAYGVQALARICQEQGLAAKIEVGKQLGRLIMPTRGCVGMVHKEFDPFPFPNLNRKELLGYAAQQFVSRLKQIGLTGPADAPSLERKLSA